MNRKILIVEDQFVEANHLRLMLQRAGYGVCGTARSVEQAEKLIETEKPSLVLLDIFLTGKRTGIELADKLRDSNIPFIYISANSNEEVLNAAKATHPNGFLVKPFREKDLLVALQIAEYHHENGLESKLRKESFFQKQLAEIDGERAGWEEKLLKIAKALQPLISFDYMVAGYSGEGMFLANNALFFLRIGFDDYQVTGVEGLQMVANLKMSELSAAQTKTVVGTEVTFSNGTTFKKLCNGPSMRKVIADTFQMNSVLTFPLPLIADPGKIFFISFYSRRNDTYSEEHVSLCYRMQAVLTKAIQNMLKAETLPPSENDISFPQETLSRVSPGNIFDGVVGQSSFLLHVFDLIHQVAPGDTSVLITGESGTGKERIADSIHALSSRKGKPFIKVNCAALPVNLIESELFGHEKGAFTGAVERRTGRFEQANGGTIFLDEIGDMPLEMQVKLLRVLQEKEIERIGGKSTIKVNIRVIAATNRNLEKEVAEGRFRLDLYYRLNVFPVQLPSLSERKEDIPLLVEHFIHYYSRKTGRKISGVSDRVMKNLMAYDWPGNIRELENLIERSVLLTKGLMIEDITLPILRTKKPATENNDRMKTIFENERDHIIAVLKKCNGRIRGAFGAAEILDIPPTTLGSKMKKLGIKREFVS